MNLYRKFFAPVANSLHMLYFRDMKTSKFEIIWSLKLELKFYVIVQKLWKTTFVYFYHLGIFVHARYEYMPAIPSCTPNSS